jgi:hypothetical protein
VLGSMIGATLEVDMLKYRRKAVILILVSFLNRDLLPLTTDVHWSAARMETLSLFLGAWLYDWCHSRSGHANI